MKAYRKQGKSLHPDLHPGDTAKEANFLVIAEASDIIGKPVHRLTGSEQISWNLHFEDCLASNQSHPEGSGPMRFLLQSFEKYQFQRCKLDHSYAVGGPVCSAMTKEGHMRHAFMRTEKLRPTAGPMGEQPALALDITDMGVQDGIEVSIHNEASHQILFETVLADPDSRMLLTVGSPETEAFWQCLNTLRSFDHIQHLLVTARCHFSVLTTAIYTKRMTYAEVRNVEFLRLVEKLLDELQTREPGLALEVAVTHRNPKFADFINY